MPQTCGVVSRADSGGLGRSDAESVIAMGLLLGRDAGRGYAVAPAKAGTHNHRPLLLRESHRPASSKTTAAASLRSQGRRENTRAAVGIDCSYPATCLMRAISSSTALSTGTFSLTTRFIALAQTFSLFSIMNFHFFVKSNGVAPPVN